MFGLPQHIIDGITSKTTSLGDNFALPSSTEHLQKILDSYFHKLGEEFKERDVNEVNGELKKLVTECQNEERKNRSALEKLCSDIVSDFFEIPEDTIRIEINLTDTVDTTGFRMLPEETEDFSFDDITDMTNLGKEIEKRRILNALVEGASECIAYNIPSYVQKLFEINPVLPALYSKIIKYSQYLMFVLNETELKIGNEGGGSVKVIMKSSPDMLNIKVDATLFPVLLQNTIKGILEVCLLQGLPDNKDKAYYVMKKADYKLAEIWDSRLGVPLWERIEKMIPDVEKVGLNFFFMELSTLPVDFFGQALQEIFVGTKRGKEIVEDICEKIVDEKEEEDFYDYIEKNNSLYPIEDGYFNESELIGEKPLFY